MANCIFLLVCHLGEGAVFALYKEDGVVAEAVAASVFINNFPLYSALCDELSAIGEYKGDEALEIGVTVGDAIKIFNKQGVIFFCICALAAVSCGIDSRCAAKGIYAKSAIVCKVIGSVLSDSLRSHGL